MAVPIYLETLLGDWKKLLTSWAASGRLTAAATEALQLKSEPDQLRRLVGQWSKGDFAGLPPIVLLPSSSMPGAAGAYAISTGTIYLYRHPKQIAKDNRGISISHINLTTGFNTDISRHKASKESCGTKFLPAKQSQTNLHNRIEYNYGTGQ